MHKLFYNLLLLSFNSQIIRKPLGHFLTPPIATNYNLTECEVYPIYSLYNIKCTNISDSVLALMFSLRC